LNAAPCPGDQIQELPPALIWEIILSLCCLSQPLCLSGSLLHASSSSKQMACRPTTALSLCCFMAHH
jgi:hypothetical protein